MTASLFDSLSNIQGNIIGGFNKDFQSFLFLHFSDPVKGRAWLGHIAPEIATSEEVTAFNALFKAANRRRGHEYGILKATWTNIAFTASGLHALGVSGADMAAFPNVFRQGMKARAAALGDAGDSAPAHWITPLGSTDVHAILHVASDSQSDLQITVARYVQNLDFNGTVKRLFTQEGIVRQDEPGHEHFGFKDGISQPGIRDMDRPQPGGNPDQGNPGQDLLWAGEFVLGYPGQISAAKPGVDGPNPDPGPVSTSGPAWTKDGSYLVFRRLRQDVAAFNALLASEAPKHGMGGAEFGAKLVGRYKSGCPMEPLNGHPHSSEAADDPAVGADPLRNNDFEYGDDADGKNIPRAAHIRKAYPRDEPTPGGGESDTQTHRILRRGIPFGVSLGNTAYGKANATFPNDRGLLFLCYQTDLERQFEFVQQLWVNNDDFPSGGDGEDPIIAQSKTGAFTLPKADGQIAHLPALPHFVTTTGGDYFFQPSISALYHLAGVAPPPGS